MSAAFADTSFFVAFLNRQDEYHAAARDYMSHFSEPIWTTDWVLTELGNYLARSAQRPIFVPFVRDLETDRRIEVVGATKKLFHAGLDLYHRRDDKTWSLTDCISFVVMDQQQLSQALTADHHFSSRQASMCC